MKSDRLTYEAVEPAHLDQFHCLVQDKHVRQYLMDGNVFPRQWSAERINASQALFERRGVGIGLAYEKTSHELVGFCGFLERPSIHPQPQLVYALFERFTGQGYATEMARAAMVQAGFRHLFAGVDEVNVASRRVLEKIGFERISTRAGRFGTLLLLRLAGDEPRHEGNPNESQRIHCNEP